MHFTKDEMERASQTFWAARSLVIEHVIKDWLEQDALLTTIRKAARAVIDAWDRPLRESSENEFQHALEALRIATKGEEQ